MIQKVCAFICFGIVIYITTQSGGWMVKALGFDKEGEGSNPIHEHVMIMISTWWHVNGSSNNHLQSPQKKSLESQV